MEGHWHPNQILASESSAVGNLSGVANQSNSGLEISTAALSASFEKCFQNQEAINEKLDMLEDRVENIVDIEHSITHFTDVLQRMEQKTSQEIGGLKVISDEILSRVLDVHIGNSNCLLTGQDIIREIGVYKAEIDYLKRTCDACCINSANALLHFAQLQPSTINAGSLNDLRHQVRAYSISPEDLQTKVTELRAAVAATNDHLNRLLELNSQQWTRNELQDLLDAAFEKVAATVSRADEQTSHTVERDANTSSHNQDVLTEELRILRDTRAGEHGFNAVVETFAKVMDQQETVEQGAERGSGSVAEYFDAQATLSNGDQKSLSSLEVKIGTRTEGESVPDSIEAIDGELESLTALRSRLGYHTQESVSEMQQANSTSLVEIPQSLGTTLRLFLPSSRIRTMFMVVIILLAHRLVGSDAPQGNCE